MIAFRLVFIAMLFQAAVAWSQPSNSAPPATGTAHDRDAKSGDAGAIDVVQYTARIAFDLSKELLAATAELRITNAGQHVDLDLRDLTATDVRVNGSPVSFAQKQGLLGIDLSFTPKTTDTISVTIVYGGHATSEAGTSSWGGCFWGSTTFSMGVGFFAPYVSMTRHWLPSHDIPSDKATFDLTFTVPDPYVVAGTGVLRDVQHDSGRTSFRWVETHPTASYLVMYAIDRYARILSDWNGLPLEYYVPTADSAKAVQHFASVPGMLEAFTRFYGPYPFDKAGYCMTPIGSMEHQTMISYAASLLTTAPAGSSAAHEMSHQWWGDCVTMRDFADTWLSEGFATFSEAVYTEQLHGRIEYERAATKFGNMYINNFAPSEGIFPLYNYPRASPSSNYPWSIYYKGAAVLVMLRQVMGDSAFFRGMRAHFNAHKYGNTSTGEFRSVMETEHGGALDWFFDEWVLKPGWPSYLVQRIADTSSAPFRIRILQVQDSLAYPFFRMPIDVRIIRTTGDTTLMTIENRAHYSEDITFPGIPSNTVKRFTLDPKNFILKYLNYGSTAAEYPPIPRPQEFSIEPAFPNPLKPGDSGTATVSIGTAGERRLRLSIFDSLGREARVLADHEWPTGRHLVPFSTDGLAPGAYTLQLRSDAGVALQRFIIGR